MKNFYVILRSPSALLRVNSATKNLVFKTQILRFAQDDKKRIFVNKFSSWLLIVVFLLAQVVPANAGVPALGEEITPGVRVVEHDSKYFRPDPDYADKPYEAGRQAAIYGGKYANPTARPLLELGRELYTSGPLRPGLNLVGKKNLLFPHAHAYGDYRAALAYNDNGAKEQWVLANRLNLDLDFQLTATERVHAFMRPLDKGGKFTRFEFGADGTRQWEGELDGNADALFFEGDLNPMLAGVTNRDMPFDLPFSAGLMPLLFQNGVWVEDAFTGAAFTIQARNSALLDISNMDVTFFMGYDKVSTPAVKRLDGNFDDDNINLWGVTSFIEAMEGYWEVGYGFIDPEDGGQDLDELSYSNMTAAFTRRYFGLVSNSVRVIVNAGQNRPDGRTKTADGFLLLIENSFITRKPLTLVPYMNLFMGIDKPQSLARDAGAGGVLKNTGILFETDGLTGFPKLDDTGNDAIGGALGVEYLFNLDQQIVLEAAVVNDIGSESTAAGNEFGLGFRYQLPITNALILRTDLIAGFRQEARDISGARVELRRKF